MTSNTDSSSTGVIQHTYFGDGGEGGDEFSASTDMINKQFQEWQEKFQEQMNAFNMNFQQQILQNLKYSFSRM